jgi:hypothetical protein
MLAPLVQNRDRKGAAATYLITWVCYGAWLSGGCSSARTRHNTERHSRNRMTQDPYLSMRSAGKSS